MLLGSLLLLPVLSAPVVTTPAQASEPVVQVAALEKPGKQGRLKLKVRTPAGVAANVQVLGKRSTVVVKGAAGRAKTATLTLPAGRYRLKADQVLSGGALYRGRLSVTTIRIEPGRTAAVRVAMQKVRQDAAIRVVDVGVGSVSLAWTAPKRAAVRVVRVPGAKQPATVRSGSLVAQQGRAVTDDATSASTTYSYGLFVQAGKRWTRASSLTVSTPAPRGESAAVVLDPNTLVLTGAEAARLSARAAARTTTSCASDLFTINWPTRAGDAKVGGGVLVQRSPAYPHGLVGKVASICPGGRQVAVADGSIPDLVNYLDVKKPSLEAGLTGSDTDAGEKKFCGKGTAQISLDNVRMGFKPGGHLNYRLGSDVLGVPTSADIDFRIAPKLTITADVTASGKATCSLPLPTLPEINFQLGPVPMTWINKPSITVKATAKGTLKDARFSLTLGRWAKGRVGVGGSGLQQGFVFEPTTSTSPNSTGEYTIGLAATFESTLGVGRASKVAGAVAGVQATLALVDASLKATDDQDGNVCVDLSAESSAALALTASVWAGPLEISGSWELLKKSAPWAKADFPTGCSIGLPTGPTILTATLPDATVGEPYHARLQTTDNRPGPWSVAGLPPGLSRDGDTITGTPLSTGDHALDVTFTDAVGRTATRSLTLRVVEPSRDLVLPWLYQFVPYDATLPARGVPGVWSVSGLPPGLSLAPREGRISGTVTSHVSTPPTLGVRFTPDGGGLPTDLQVPLRISRMSIGLLSLCAIESPASGRFALLYGSDTSDAPTLPGKFVVNGVESAWGTKAGTTYPGWVRKKVVVMSSDQTYNAEMWVDGHKIAQYTNVSTAMPLENNQCGHTTLLRDVFPVAEEILGN